jgi:preprotein translocase subunit YajC
VFISNAYAQSGGSTEQQLLGFLPIVLMFVVLYFLMIRPQMKRAKEHRQMLEALSKGDEVVTAGGIVGKVTKVGDGYVTLEVSHRGDEAIEMQMQKQAIQTLLPKGTIKAI